MVTVHVQSSLMNVRRSFDTNKAAIKYLRQVKRHHDMYNTGEGAYLKVTTSETKKTDS